MLGTDLFIVSPILPEVARDFGIGVGAASAMAWSFALVYALLSPVVTLATNRLTRRAAMSAGAVIFAAGALGVGLMPTFDLVVAARVVTGVGAAIMGPPVWAFASETAAPHEVGTAISRVAATFAAGQVIGVPLGSWLASVVSWRWIFIGSALILAVLACLILRRLGGEDRVPDRVSLPTAARQSLGLWRQRGFAWMLTANFFAQGTRYATYTFAGALLLAEFGLGTVQLGLVGMSVGLGSFVGSAAGGRLVDRVRARGGSQSLLNVACALVLTLSLVLATSTHILWLSLLAWIVGFAAGSAFVSNGQEMLTRMTGAHRAFALSWNNAGLYAGTAFGVMLLSSVPLGGASFVAIVGGLGGSALLASLAVWRVSGRHRPA